MSSANADDDVKAAIANVHSDTSGVEWAVIGYKHGSKNDLTVVATGTGGLGEVTPHLPADDAAYAIIRYKLTIDKSTNVRFAFVDWTPENTPVMKKSAVSTQKGSIKKLMEPTHVDLIASDSSDLDENVILNKIGAASGTKSNIVETKSSEKTAWVPKGGAHAAPKASGPSISSINAAVKVNFVNEDEFKAGLTSLRDSSTETTWFLAALNDHLALEVAGSGPGGVEEMLAAARDGTANYGVVRVTDVIDKSSTTKYALVVYMPDDVAPLRKGKINTIAGNIKDLFAPYHVDFFINSKDEITQSTVEDKIKTTSGSKSKVKN